MGLAKSAIIPTFIMGACFMLIPSSGMTKDPKAPEPTKELAESAANTKKVQ